MKTYFRILIGCITPLLASCSSLQSNTVPDIKTLQKFDTVFIASGIHLTIQCTENDLPFYDTNSTQKKYTVKNENGKLTIEGDSEVWDWGSTNITINIPQKLNKILAFNGSRIEAPQCALNQKLTVELYEGSRATLCDVKHIEGRLTSGSKLYISENTTNNIALLGGAKINKEQC